MTVEIATFAAGCFWGVEAAFSRREGVITTRVGYTGGNLPDPTYEDVCGGHTGHAEAVELEFNPEVVTYGQLLEQFWEIHDPTTVDRQGPDVGSQYRSAIFFHSPAQERAATDSLEGLRQSGCLTRPIVTKISPASTFYPAEEYHQKYFLRHGR